MAIDPSISLGFRPPVIPPSQILNPVEQFGQILSLRNLMTQGQLGQLGLQTHQLELQKLQQEMAGQDRINKILAARSAAAAPLQTAPAIAPVTPTAPLSTLMTPQAPAAAGLITPGNIDLHSRPIVKNPDGSISTVRSASFDQDDKEVLVPTVSDDGRILSNEEAWAQYKKTGKHLGIFDSPQNATAYAQQLHQDQAAEYSPQSATGAPLSTLMTPQAPAPTPTAPAPVPGRAPSAAAVSIADPYAGLPSDAELIRQGGTAGFTIVKNLNAAREAYYKQQQEKIKLHQEALTGMASLAAGAHDEPSKVEAIAAAFNNKWIDGPMRDQLMSHPYNKKEWDGFQVDALGGVKRLQELRDQVNQTALEKKQAHDQAMYSSEEAKGAAEATTAEQKAAGTERITPYQQAQLDLSKVGLTVPTSPAVEQQEIRIAGAKADAQAKLQKAIDGMSPSQANLVNSIATRYDNHPLVKDYNTQANKFTSMKSLLDKKLGGPGDVAIIYDFMKALDPNSVVRESEYAAAAKSGNIFSGALAKFNGYLKPTGGFLPEKLKQEFLDVVGNRMNVSRDQIGNIYQDFGRRIDKITGKPGTGTDYLTNYGDLYKAAGGKAVTPEVTKALSGAERGKIHQLSDGSVWLVNADGSIEPTTAPKQ